MRTRTKGIRLEPNGERIIDKQYRGQRIFERLGAVSQDEAEAWLRQRQTTLDAQRSDGDRPGARQLFRYAAGKYLTECLEAPDVRTSTTIGAHILLLNQYVGDLELRDVCNDSFAAFKADRLAGRTLQGERTRPVKPSTVNRTLEVARTILNRAARVWRTNGVPWLGASPLIEMLDETVTRRRPYPITWQQQGELLPRLPAHLQRMVLFALNTGARDENVCGLRWEWEVPVPEVQRSVFIVPATEFKGKRPHVLILNDVAWRIVEEQRGKDKTHVFVYRRERVKRFDKPPAMEYHRVGTINNTGYQNARAAVGLQKARVHDLRHTYGQRLIEAGVAEEDRNLLLGHASGEMAQLYATSTVSRLIELANKVQETRDRMTLLRVVNG